MKFVLIVALVLTCVFVVIPVEDYFTSTANKVTNEYFLCIGEPKRFWRHDSRKGVFGQFGNNALSLFHAMFYAKKHGFRVAVLTKNKQEIYLRHSLEFSGNVVWDLNEEEIHCAIKFTWEEIFFKKNDIRENYLNEFSVLRLNNRFREKAEIQMKKINADFSVHGRSFEGNCFFSRDHEHTPVPCNFTHNLCKDHRYNTVTKLFNLTGRPIVFSDGQSLYNDITYYKPGGVIDKNEFLVQLWMMVLSKHHVGDPGSSLDYLIWQWKKQYYNNTVMYPTQCYPIYLKT